LDPPLVIIGLFVGAIVGLTGIGAGSLLTPILLLLGVGPVVAVGTSLTNSILMRTAGAIQHDRQGTLSRQLALPLLAGAVPGAVVGSLAVVHFSVRAPAETDLFLKVAIGVALFVASLTVLSQILVQRKAREEPKRAHEIGAGVLFWPFLDTNRLPSRLIAITVTIGLLTGLVTSVSSIGVGSFLLPFLILALRARIRLNRIVGTVVAVGAAIGLVATTIYLVSGTVQIGPLLSLMLGSIPGVMIGSRMNAGLNATGMRVAISSVTLIAAFVIIYEGIVNG